MDAPDTTRPDSTRTISAHGSSYHGLTETYRAQRGLLMRIATSITHSSADAEDIVQLAFLRAYERKQTMSLEPSLHWLKTVVRRLAIDRIRQRATHARYEALWRDVFCSEASDTFATMQRMQELCALALTLPSATRCTFALWCAGASYESIALAQRVPIGTVATRVLRARAQVRAMRA